MYIGITVQEPKKRWKTGKGYHSARFASAIEKYGWDGFSHEVVKSGLTEEEACKQERQLIRQYDATNPQHGYNREPGGQVGAFYKNHHTQEAKEKIRNARKRDGFTEEHKQHISEAKRGANHHFAKPVYQYTKSGEFVRAWDYMSHAAKELKIKKGCISANCIGRTKTAGGFVWSYSKR